MARYSRFNFLCDDHERQIIADLASRLQRSQSDAVRFVVIETARQLSQAPVPTIPPLQLEAAAHPAPIVTAQPTHTRKRKQPTAKLSAMPA